MDPNFHQAENGSDQPLGGRYKIIEKLAAGGFGQTFRAQDLHLPGHPFCVVKQLKPQVDDPRGLQVARRLFDTEAQVLYRLGSHAQIPNLLAHFEQDQEFYLAQELIEGNDLADEFANTPWPVAQVVDFLLDVLQTLAFVHENGVIHRDLKPSNLIRRRLDRRIVLIDFGAVKQVGTQPANTTIGQTISIGTHGYMPSEQLAGQPKFSSDVYAVGIMGIQALTGQLPQQLMPDAKTGEIVWHGAAAQVPNELGAVLDKMVRYDFRSRYPAGKEALAALRAIELPTMPGRMAPSMSVATEPAPTALTVPAMGRQPASEPVPVDRTVVASEVPPANGKWLLPALGAVAIVSGLLAAYLFKPAPATLDPAVRSDPAAPADNAAAVDTPAPETSPPEISPPDISEPAPPPVPPEEDGDGDDDDEKEEKEPKKPKKPKEPEEPEEPKEPEEEQPDLTPAMAQTTITEFYDHLSNRDWDAAKAQAGGTVAQQFDPDFFEPFQRIDVDNLQVIEESADTLTLLGLNTYIYRDGTTQKEERTFTVQVSDGQPRIVDSTFVRITKGR